MWHLHTFASFCLKSADYASWADLTYFRYRCCCCSLSRSRGCRRLLVPLTSHLSDCLNSLFQTGRLFQQLFSFLFFLNLLKRKRLGSRFYLYTSIRRLFSCFCFFLITALFFFFVKFSPRACDWDVSKCSAILVWVFLTSYVNDLHPNLDLLFCWVNVVQPVPFFFFFILFWKHCNFL